jgi:hypothetical protein
MQVLTAVFTTEDAGVLPEPFTGHVVPYFPHAKRPNPTVPLSFYPYAITLQTTHAILSMPEELTNFRRNQTLATYAAADNPNIWARVYLNTLTDARGCISDGVVTPLRFRVGPRVDLPWRDTNSAPLGPSRELLIRLFLQRQKDLEAQADDAWQRFRLDCANTPLVLVNGTLTAPIVPKQSTYCTTITQAQPANSANQS